MTEIMSKTNGFSVCNRYNTSFYQRKRCYNQINGRIVCLIPKNKSVKSLVIGSSSTGNFYGRRVITGAPNLGLVNITHRKSLNIEMSIGIAKAQRWWEKGTKTNMKEVEGPNDLVESLLNAGDKLVVVEFFSPGCGGCKALHPKICQLAEMNPDVQFLQVNYEEHKSMCYSLNVHVLPFFRFYRGAHGRLCSFSCTNATIKKFKDALAKHSPDRCSLGEPKGLEEKELLALSANRDLSFTYKPKLPKQEESLAEPALTTSISYPPSVHPLRSKTAADAEEKTLVSTGR